MALRPTNSINVPETISGTGTSARASLLSGHIFNAGLEKPEILESLIVKFPNFWFSQLLESIPQVSGTIFSDVYTWQKLDRTRKSSELNYISGTGTDAIVVDAVDITASGADLGYFLEGDIVRVAETGVNYRVTAVAANGGLQRLTLALHNGGNIAEADVDGFHAGHIGTGFARGSSASGGTRVHLPDTDFNVTNIHRRGFVIERGAMSQKTYVDNKSWYFKNEDIEQKEFMRDFQAKLLFGKRYQNRATVNETRGIMEYAENSGNLVTFAAAQGVQESDWVSLTESLLPQQGSDDLVVLMGERIFLQNQMALADRYRSIPNSEKPAQLAGLNFTSYEIGNKKFHFKYFDMFSDTAIVPSVTPSATAKDFRNVALVLDMGTVTGGERNIQVKYRDGAKFIQKMIPGMAGDGMVASNAYDGIQGELLCEFTTACLLPNRLGLVYANS
jgi:hypothetical protein